MRFLQVYIFVILFVFVNDSVFAQAIDSLLQIRDKANTALELYEVEKAIIEAYVNQYDLTKIQSHIDNLIQAAQKIEDSNYKGKAYQMAGAIANYQNQYDKSDSLLILGLEYATDKEIKARIYNERFKILIRRGSIEKGATYLKKMREQIEDTTSVLMVHYYFSYSNYYGEQRDLLNKLIFLQKAKKLAVQNNHNIRYINHNLSAVFEALNAYENALEIQLELRELAQKENDYVGELFSFFGIMGAYYGLKDYENVKKYGYKAINFKNQTGEATAFGYIYYLLGYAHLEEEQLDSAEYYFNKGVEISKARNEAKELDDNHSGLCKLYYLKGDLEKARFHGEETMKHISYIHTDNNSILGKIYAKSGDYKKAYDLLRINWSDWEETERERRDYELIANLLNEKFEEEKEEEQALFQEKINRQRRLLIGIIVTLVFVLLAVIIFIQTRNNRQLKNLNNRLQKRNNALQQFSYIASHDIKEPIRSVGNYISLIRRRLPKAEKEKMTDYFDIIDDSLKQTYTLIEDVMQYTEIGQDEAVTIENTDLNTVVKNVTVGLESYIQEKNGQVEFSNLPTIQSSSSLLFIVFKNLIQNGLKFNRSTIPTIKINYENIGDNHIIRITDNGIGIEDDYYEHVFKMFKRLHTRREFKGTGLGLAITENVINKLNGTIEVETSSTNGTTFKISLPKNI